MWYFGVYRSLSKGAIAIETILYQKKCVSINVLFALQATVIAAFIENYNSAVM